MFNLHSVFNMNIQIGICYEYQTTVQSTTRLFYKIICCDSVTVDLFGLI